MLREQGFTRAQAAGSSAAACSLERAHFCEEPNARLNAFEEIGEMDLFVRPVDAIIGQTEAHQHNGDLECVLDQVTTGIVPPLRRKTAGAPKACW